MTYFIANHFAYFAELGPGDESFWVPLGFGSCRESSALIPQRREALAYLFSFVLFVFFTEQLVGQHVELLLVQASVGDGGELPAENLGQLRPLGLGRVEEELQVLRKRREKK